MAELSQGGTLPESNWLNPTIHTALEESARVLEELAVIVLEREEALQLVFSPAALHLDLRSIRARFEQHHKGLKKWSKQAREDKRSLRSVAVSGTVTKDTISRLGEAVAWQSAQESLAASEAEYGPRLENYYTGPRTDFGRIREALEVARQAVRLAGRDINPRALAAQLSRGSTPDFALLPVARNTEERLQNVAELIATPFNSDFSTWVQTAPMAEVMSRLERVESRLEEFGATRSRLVELGASEKALHEAREALEQIRELAKLESAMLSKAASDGGLLGRDYRGFDTDWAKIEADLGWCSEARSQLGAPLVPDAIPYIKEFDLSGEDVRSSLERWGDVSQRFFGHFEQTRAAELREEFDSDLEGAIEIASAMKACAAADVDVWFEFKRLRRWAAEHGLADAVEGLEREGAAADEIGEALERAALEPWVEGILGADSRLESYRAANREALVKEYRNLDQRLVTAAYSAVVNACTAKRPRSNAGPAAVIAHEANKKSRHKPIRRLLDEAGDIAQALKPCFMMSPLSVSQYLPSTIRFDVVIFDEASQVMPADAVNCIYRGDQLIVAGDQKQLPPTSFFSSTDVETDDEDVPDNFDSVLDLCKASGSMPSIPLTWHYRSLHEDLITYSNYRFYEGKLNTFPGATHIAADLGVHHEYVAGEYKRGGGAKNPVEADKVVDRILEHRKNNSGYSLGVVTFSTAQADAISEAIERRVDSEPLLAGLMDDHNRLHGFFVKNLESVQGDERDIIIFSVGYGPDEHGKFVMNFGPLTRKGGQRRLNVAITRARRRVEIVSSFMPSQMVDGSSEGNGHL
ncbi:MAG: DNA2/NAM7 family helicase [Nitrospirota bacterium]|nr:DNA2/NAM7 family helicase [Nitrospirota bacterium]